MRQPSIALATLATLVALAACAPPVAPTGSAAAGSPPPAGGAPTASTLTPPPGSGPTAGQVAGRWYTGTGAEPPAGPLRIELSCGYKLSPAVYEPKEFGRDGWVIAQTGEAVQISANMTFSPGPTGPQPACPTYALDLTGTYRGGVLTLTGTERLDRRNCPPPTPGPSADPQASPAATPAPTATALPLALTLTFDAASQHLRGTRDGQPFWAVPLEVIDPPAECGPVAMP